VSSFALLIKAAVGRLALKAHTLQGLIYRQEGSEAHLNPSLSRSLSAAAKERGRINSAHSSRAQGERQTIALRPISHVSN